MPTESLDLLVYELWRPTHGGTKLFPQEVTVAGFKRRLGVLRTKYGRDPDWDHPEVQATLVRALARRITDRDLPILLDTWVQASSPGDAQDRLQHALGQALGLDHAEAARGAFKIPGATPPTTLLTRLAQAHASRLDDWARAWPGSAYELQLPEGFDAWRRWVMAGVRARVAQGLQVPGETNTWTTVVRVHQAMASPDSQADFAWLLAQRPDLAGAAHFDHRGWPVLACRMGHEPQDTVALQHLMAHPEVLRAPTARAWTKSRTYSNPWLDWPDLPSRYVHQDTLPVWMMMGLQAHPATNALMAMATPAEQARFLNVRTAQEIQRIPLDTSLSDKGASLQTLADRVRQAPAWEQPTTLTVSPTGNGDTHPLWAALHREPRLLALSYQGHPLVPGFREDVAAQPHRLNAQDANGGNLWWAMAGGERQVDATRQVLGLLAQHQVYAQPDHQGRGLFFRHPHVADVFRRAISGSEEAFFACWTDNPFWDSMHRHPEGFLGSTPEGQLATAQALWADVGRRQWYKQPWPEAQSEALMLVVGFDQQNPKHYHPTVRLLVTTTLALINGVNGKAKDDLQQWAPDPSDPEVAALMTTSPYYLHVAEQNPALPALMRAQSLYATPPTPVRTRRRLRS